MSLMPPAWARSRTWSRKASNGSVYCMRNYINLFMHSAGVEPNLLVRALHASSYVPRGSGSVQLNKRAPFEHGHKVQAHRVPRQPEGGLAELLLIRQGKL